MGCHEYFSKSRKTFKGKLSFKISNANRFMYLIFLAITTWSTTNSISLDTKYPLIFEDISEGNSYFGYSVLLYSGNGGNYSWIQIGAPRANQSFNGRKDVFEPGAVYRCQLSPLEMCKPVMISDEENKIEPGVEKRDSSWMGAAMDVQPGPYGRLVVCSPRWVQHTYASYYMPGACYWSSAEDDGNKTFGTLLPLLNYEKYSLTSNGKEVPYFAYGEAGLSVHFPLEKPIEASSKLAIGVPGLFNWKGGLVLYEADATHVLHRGSFTALRFPVHGVTKFKDGDYTGYQVNSGYFFRKDYLLYVVSAPRAEAAKGKVLILYAFEKNNDEFSVSVRREIFGIQCGEYFGASIAVGDLNGDSYDDLIVGAPFYSNDDVMEEDYDRGRVAIYLSVPVKGKGNPNMKEGEQKLGYKPGGRFGSSVMFLGDINSDGIPEVAIGAPYEDDNRGVVYIYSSNAEGKLAIPIQRISARDTYESLKGFGISISPHNTDIDRNGCPDVAIGAYLSGHAVIYRGKPMIKWIIQNPEPYPKSITHNATDFLLNFACVTYLGKSAPNDLRIKRRIELDFRCKDSTITKIITVERGVTLCHNFTISLKPNIRDLHKPIEVKISYELLKQEEDTKTFILVQKNKIHGKDSFCPKCPVSKSLSPATLTVPFVVNCGGDALCTTDLIVTGEFPELKNGSYFRQKQEIVSFVTGSLSTLLFQVTVSNNDSLDTAYFTHVYVEIGAPGSISRFLTECHEITSLPVLNYTRMKENDNSTESSSKVRLQPSYVECETGNILPGEKKNILFELDMTNVQGFNEIMLTAWATTVVNNETNPLDNIWEGKVQLNNEADIAVFGNGLPEISFVVLDSENKTESQTSFIHNYVVQKFGYSKVEEVNIEIQIPMYITEKKSKEQIKFLTLKDYKGSQGRQTLPCSLPDSSDLDDDIKSHSISKKSATENTYNISRREVSNNRTLYVNCSSPEIIDTHLIECRTINCVLGPFTSSQSLAKVSLKMEIDVQKLKHLMGSRHIIFLKTHGIIKVVNPDSLHQPSNHKPDHAMAHSTFVTDVPKKKIETWVYAAAIGSGIMIVLFLQMALAKAGFFKRKKKDELKALKRQTLLMNSEDFLLQQRLREKSEDKEKEYMEDPTI